MGGIDHINYQCQKEAYAANVTGIYRAFLSSKTMDLPRLVKEPQDKVLNLYNETLFPSWASIFKRASKIQPPGPILSPSGHPGNIFSFDGKNVIIDEHWYASHLSNRRNISYERFKKIKYEVMCTVSVFPMIIL
jgi:hypothetical protein